ncbi:hypothetical protein PIB30_103018 [Stylosanthes scabra]|uniref:Aminotransferase-like plant mobile domain-containing protein n=1 Tax=Stylosanthes scabra TaxID=79078 RepID=A0ABU6YZQ6_9FABA|nr:hypothetical protein [Stylosanthes scabra]
MPLLDNFDGISGYSWGSRVLCDVPCHRMHGCHTLSMSWIYYRLPSWAPNLRRPHTFPLATRWKGRRGNNDYSEVRLVRYCERLDLLSIDDFMWMSYNAASIMSVVPQEFIGTHGDFFTSAVPLIFFRFIEVLPVDRVLRQLGANNPLPGHL